MSKRFHVKVRDRSPISKFCIIDKGEKSNHETVICNIPDYLGERREFAHIITNLLNDNRKYKIKKTLI